MLGKERQCIKKKIVFAVFFYSFSLSFAQTNYWFFGDNAGLDFSSGSPIPITGQSVSDESSAAVSDPITGNLLFYTNGITVWDKNHNPMANGTGLLGHHSSAMGALIVPQPRHPNIYYLFTADAYQNNGANGFRYHIIDMNANGGLGKVISKNNLLFTPCAEVNHAVIHANCKDYWIIARSATGNTYYLYLLTENGIQPPVINNIGLTTSASGWGQSKFSPDGTKFATALGTFNFENYLQLFEFNNSTGILSNDMLLSTQETSYGVSFSPNSKKLYAGLGSYFSQQLYQYDVSVMNFTAVVTSQLFLSNMPFYPPALQIGKDFKIYCSELGKNYLNVIKFPNNTGSFCVYATPGILLAPSTVGNFGLPIFPENYFDQTNANAIFSLSSDATIDYGSSITLWVNGSGSWVQWYPTDNLSCSNCVNPVATPTETTTYYVSYNDGVHCPATRQVTIHVDYNPQIPNIFTPNNDGVNDFFHIKNLPPESKIKIYNRWGNLIYSSADYHNDWTTDVNGVYYYVLEVKTDKVFKGFVEVVSK